MLNLCISPAQLFVFVCCYVSVIRGDYYWRDYTGIIPFDAFVAGKDINNKSIYVGQAYIKGNGIIVGQINEGVPEIYLPIYGVKKTSLGAKILCTKVGSAFTWMVTNSTLGTTLLNKQVVIGGLENDHILYIGRVFAQGEIKVGKVVTFNPDDSLMFFVENDKEKNVKNYEILLIDENPIDVRSH